MGCNCAIAGRYGYYVSVLGYDWQGAMTSWVPCMLKNKKTCMLSIGSVLTSRFFHDSVHHYMRVVLHGIFG